MKTLPILAALLVSAAAAYAQEKTITVDFAKSKGAIKPLHDVHNGPLCKKGTIDLTPYYKELGIRFVRIHDAPWAYDEAVDTHTVFPDFSADPEDPKIYRFESTDKYVKSIVDFGGEVIFRLGESCELSDRKYNVPPADFAKWARINVNIVRHYNDGWAEGFKYGLKYFEIWNEPDIKNFWTGAIEQYLEMYEVAAKALKAHDPNLKVGGPALAANHPFLKKFLKHCRDKQLPLDFVSWHSYGTMPWGVSYLAGMVAKQVDEYGFTSAEIMLNEWNYFPGLWDRLYVDEEYGKAMFERIRGVEGAAYAGGMLTFLQDARVDAANFYTGTTPSCPGWGMFDDSGKPCKNYYAFRAFRSVLDTPVRVETKGTDQDAFGALAGLSEDKQSASVMISNLKSPADAYKLVLKNAPWTAAVPCRVYVVDEANNLAEVDKPTLEPGGTILIKDAGHPSVCLIKINSDLGPGGPLKR